MEVNDKYFAGLTEAQWDEHAKIEAELNALNSEGYSENAAQFFVTVVSRLRKIEPKVTVEGVFEEAFIRGLRALVDDYLDVPQPAHPTHKRKIKKSGVKLVT